MMAGSCEALDVQDFQHVSKVALATNVSEAYIFLLAQKGRIRKIQDPNAKRGSLYSLADAKATLGAPRAKRITSLADIPPKQFFAPMKPFVETGVPAPAPIGMRVGIEKREEEDKPNWELAHKARVEISQNMAKKAMDCQKKGLHEAERVLLWMIVETLGVEVKDGT